MNKPLVSIILPTYNRGHLLPRAIKSILAQTYQNFELIVVDDVSTDNTKEVVANFKDKRIKYIRLNYKKNEFSCGAAKARNVGIKNSEGKFVCFIDSDDVYLPQKLEKQVNMFHLLTEDYGVVYCGFRFIYDLNQKVSEDFLPGLRGDVHVDLLKNNICSGITPLVKKECFLSHGYWDEKLPSSQDWDLWIRISKTYKFDFVPEVLAEAHIQGEQISTNLKNKLTAKKRIFYKYYNEISLNKTMKSKHLGILGTFSSIAEKPKDAVKYYIKSVLANPFQKGVYFHLLFVLLLPSVHRRFLYKKRLKKYGNITIAGFK